MHACIMHIYKVIAVPLKYVIDSKKKEIGSVPWGHYFTGILNVSISWFYISRMTLTTAKRQFIVSTWA